MTRWLVSLAVVVGLLTGVWTEGVRLYAWAVRRAADRSYYGADLDSALAGYERLCRLLPRDPRSHIDLASAIGQALAGTSGRQMDLPTFEERAVRGARAYLRAIRESPPSAGSFAGLGAIARSLGVARVLNEEIDLSVLSADPLESMRPEDRFCEAALVKAVQLEPRDYYLRDFLGAFYLRLGMESRALAHIQAAVRLHPVLDRHFYLSELVRVSPAVLTAVEAGIREALAGNNRAVSPFRTQLSLADVYLRQGRVDDALASLEAASAVAPSPHLIDIRVGMILAEQGDDEGALRAFRSCVEHDPHHFRGWIHLGVTLSRLGRHDEAIEACRRARGLRPTNFTALSTLARVQEQAGRLDDAALVLESLIRAHPDRSTTYLQLITIYERLGRTSQAIRVARLLVDQHPEEQAFRDQLEQLERALAQAP
jgi:tetratricopeptide (TPR) repeat protein